jgi:hypothetical protein
MTGAPQWQEVEIAVSGPEPANPYLDVDAWATFRHPEGHELRRPLYWDAGGSYRIRFASPVPSGQWEWEIGDDRFEPRRGTLTATSGDPDHPHRALRHGFVTAAGRAFRHADGTPAFLVVDTAWALPWRATVDEAVIYADDRQAKGFTAALLMSLQPDMDARGPRSRTLDEGFDVAFEDLPSGRLTRLNVGYFRYLDRLVEVLVRHGITPVWQPVFHGYGWKGLRTAGPVVPPGEYARYCRYLVARYGARPAVWLPGADGAGTEPQIEAGGRAFRAADAYRQPVGIHYRPHRRPDAHQDADWLDFQACQTGHGGDHVPDRVATMWAQQPPKAVMNGEPTYEHTGRRGVAEGWWQGHEAWSNVCAGALIGVAYGAASLWQWRKHPDEPGHGAFFLCPDAGWREALEFEGSAYVGLVGRILEGLPLAGASPCWDVGLTTRGLLDPAVLYLGYQEHGGPWMFLDSAGRVPSRFWLIDPRTGKLIDEGVRPPDGVPLPAEPDRPAVLICSDTVPPYVSGPAYRINMR